MHVVGIFIFILGVMSFGYGLGLAQIKENKNENGSLSTVTTWYVLGGFGLVILGGFFAIF